MNGGCNLCFDEFVLTVVSFVTAVSAALAQDSVNERQTVEKIRSALLCRPYYGVFDFLVLRHAKGTVTLSGVCIPVPSGEGCRERRQAAARRRRNGRQDRGTPA